MRYEPYTPERTFRLGYLTERELRETRIALRERALLLERATPSPATSRSLLAVESLIDRIDGLLDAPDE